MNIVTVFKAQNDLGQDLLDRYVLPICKRIGVECMETRADANRATAMGYQWASDLVLWDCSVEAGHVYNALTNWVKTTRKHAIVSRTPLPRNVLAHYQCAPIHGERFDNDVLGEWLDVQLPAILRGRYSSTAYRNPALARHYWMFEAPARYFLSFRGTVCDAAAAWREAFERGSGTTVRMVAEGEYSYPCECMTQQQIWEGVARLMHEMKATQRVLVYWSDDYLDSFWTSSELLAALWMLGRDPRTGTTMIEDMKFVRNDRVLSLRDGFKELGILTMDRAAMDRFPRLINNADPITSAPETQVPPSGLAKVIRFLFKDSRGYYDPEFMRPSFWQTVRVPCPACRPHHRRAGQIDWNLHMALPGDERTVDGFGYFPADPAELETGVLSCPGCKGTLRLENKRGVRTIWAPIMTTEKDRTRPVIQEHKVWEVVA